MHQDEVGCTFKEEEKKEKAKKKNKGKGVGREKEDEDEGEEVQVKTWKEIKKICQKRSRYRNPPSYTNTNIPK